MRKWMAVALLLALAAGAAHAQSVVQDGQSTRQVQQSMLGGHLYRADSTQWSNSGDGAGNLYTTEASPDRSFLYKYQNVMQVGSLWRVRQCQAAPTLCTFVLPQADSSSTMLTLGATHLALMVTYSMDADSGCASLMGLEVRGHSTANSDSVSTFKWRWRAATASPTDTIGSQATTSTGATVNGFVTTALDSTNVGPFEAPVWLNNTQPYRAIYIPLVNRDTGELFSAPYTSIKARIVKQYGSTACTAWTGKLGALTAFQITMVGWR